MRLLPPSRSIRFFFAHSCILNRSLLASPFERERLSASTHPMVSPDLSNNKMARDQNTELTHGQAGWEMCQSRDKKKKKY
jgi:hypothetical protein